MNKRQRAELATSLLIRKHLERAGKRLLRATAALSDEGLGERLWCEIVAIMSEADEAERALLEHWTKEGDPWHSKKRSRRSNA